MIDVSNPDTRVSIAQVAARLGVDRGTVYRWMKYGVRDVRLASGTVGVRLFTTEAALTAFTEALSPPLASVVERRATLATDKPACG